MQNVGQEEPCTIRLYTLQTNTATAQTASCIVLCKEARIRSQGNVGLAGVKVKGRFTLKQATKAHTGRRGVAQLFL